MKMNVCSSLVLVTLLSTLPAMAQQQNNDTQNGQATQGSTTTTQGENNNATSDRQESNPGNTTGSHRVTSSGNQDRTEVTKRLNDAAEDLNRLTTAGDNNIPQSILADAKCVAIVPSLVKGGFIVGAQHGRGVATCRLPNHTWSAPAFFTITGGSWGAQIGLEGVDLVMLFMTQEGANKLLDANWKIGADAGIAAGPFGREASANTDWKLNTGILTYSRAKGVFAGATLNGANVRADVDSIRSFYGRTVDFRSLLEGKVPPPPAAHSFLAQIRQNFREANAAK